MEKWSVFVEFDAADDDNEEPAELELELDELELLGAGGGSTEASGEHATSVAPAA